MPVAEGAEEKKRLSLVRGDWTSERRSAIVMGGRDVVPGRRAEEEHGRAEED